MENPGRSQLATRRILALVPDVVLVLALGIVSLAAARRWALPSLVAFGDHPGQFMRLWYPLAESLPRFGRLVDWNPLWYAGYPELQFYPPGHALLGAVVNGLTLSRLSPEVIYNLVAALALVLPVFTTFAFLRSTLAGLGRWPSRAAATCAGLATLGFWALWGGTNAVAIGMVGERLAFGLGPLVLLAGWRLAERPTSGRLVLASVVLAAVVLMHPFHAPALVLAVGAYALGRYLLLRRNAPGAPATASGRTWVWLLAWPALAIGLTAWWLAPLLARQSPFAAQLARANFDQILDYLRFTPLPWLMLAGIAGLATLRPQDVRPVDAHRPRFDVGAALRGGAWRGRPRRAAPTSIDPIDARPGGDERQESLRLAGARAGATFLALAGLIPALVLWILFDTLVLVQRLNFASLDPIRFIAEYYMAGLLLGGLALATALSTQAWRNRFVGAACLILVLLALRPAVDPLREGITRQLRPVSEATLADIEGNPALAGLWQALREDPAADGRVLFTSYYLQLKWPDGGTLPTSVKSLTPYFTGREIMGGTFSHWAPVARLMWVGDPWARSLPERVELDDDVRLLDRPWDEITDEELYGFTRAFNVTTVVAGPGDEAARAMLNTASHFQQFWTNGYFTLYHTGGAGSWIEASGATAILRERQARRWTIEVASAQPGATLTVDMAYYPLWRAEAGGQALAVRADELARQQIVLPAGGPYEVTLTYRDGWPEILGTLLTAGSLLLAGVLVVARLKKPGLLEPGAGRPSVRAA